MHQSTIEIHHKCFGVLISWYIWSIRQHFGHPWLRQRWLSSINSPINCPCSFQHMRIANSCLLWFLHRLYKCEMIKNACHPQPYSPFDCLLHHENNPPIWLKFSLFIIIHILFLINFFLFRFMSKFNLLLLIKLILFLFRLINLFLFGCVNNLLLLWLCVFFIIFFTWLGFGDFLLAIFGEIPHVYILF